MSFLEDKQRMRYADLATWHFKTDKKEKFFNFLKLRGIGFISNCKSILPWIYENLLIIKFENINESLKKYSFKSLLNLPKSLHRFIVNYLQSTSVES